jgi:hypothetical protein
VTANTKMPNLCIVQIVARNRGLLDPDRARTATYASRQTFLASNDSHFEILI